ncbi:MAG: DUF4491 family protein [Clostridiales bacterium]|jgi:hypothetical protein|nr:DUF4491 family protein [Clostridiales bacterium]
MNFDGILIGVMTFLIIGALHPIIIKAHFHMGTKVWPLFLLAGLICAGASLFCHTTVLGAVLAVAGFSLLWSIHEVFEQEERVQKGWFPANPKNAAKNQN